MTVRRLLTATALAVGLEAALIGGAWADTLRIGVIAPLTGGGAPWGMAAAEATKIRAAEINAAGGLDVGGETYELEVIAYDDQFKAADAVAAYNRLVNQDGVRYMIIHTSAAAVALKQNVEDDEVLALTGGYTPKAIDADTRQLFRIYSAPLDYLPGLVAWMGENLTRKADRPHQPQRRDRLGPVEDHRGALRRARLRGRRQRALRPRAAGLPAALHQGAGARPGGDRPRHHRAGDRRADDPPGPRSRLRGTVRQDRRPRLARDRGRRRAGGRGRPDRHPLRRPRQHRLPAHLGRVRRERSARSRTRCCSRSTTPCR